MFVGARCIDLARCVPSKALEALTERLSDVDQLVTAHQAVAGSARGRKWEVEGLNRAAVLMLCSHFEGYLEDVMAEALGYRWGNETLDRGVCVRVIASLSHHARAPTSGVIRKKL